MGPSDRRPSRRFGPLVTLRFYSAAVGLPTERVLLAGGGDGDSGTRNTAELFDPVTGGFTSIGMTEARSKHAAARLADSAMLVAGGQMTGTQFLASAEVLDHVTKAFGATASLSSPRLGHTATALADGRVVVAGGLRPTAWASTEIFTWRATTSRCTFRFEPTMTRGGLGHGSVLLDNGRVLAPGGRSSVPGGITYAIEEFDPAAGGSYSAWPNHAWFLTNQRDHAIAALPGETRALVAGGLTSGLTPATSFEVVPQGGEGRMLSARTLHAMTPTRTSPTMFWVIGGLPAFSGPPTTTLEKRDAGDLSTTAMPELGTGRAHHSATLLPDGRVRMAGGRRSMDGATATAELSKSTICAAPPPFGFRPRGKVTFGKTYLHIDPKRFSIRAPVGDGGRRNNPAFDLVSRDGDERCIVPGRMPVPKLRPAERTRLTANLALPARLPEGGFGIRACVVPQALLAANCFDIPGSVVRGTNVRQDHFPHLQAPGKSSRVRTGR